MHLLAAQTGTISDGTEAMDLGQSPADMVVLSAADTELGALATAYGAWEGVPVSLRLANLLRLGHHMSVDLYIEQVIEHARLVVVRLLGGRSYWPYGIEQIVSACRRKGIALALLPGADEDSTLASEAVERLWRYLLHGGPDNARSFLAYGANLIGADLSGRDEGR